MWLSRSSRSRCHEFKSWPTFLNQNNPTSPRFVRPKWPLGVNPTFLRLRKNASQWNLCSETIDQVGGGVRKKRQKFRLRFRDHGFDTCYFENWLGEIFFFHRLSSLLSARSFKSGWIWDSWYCAKPTQANYLSLLSGSLASCHSN